MLRLFKSKPKRARWPSAPVGMRIYAIGDVHARLDLLRELLAQIEAEDAASPRADTHVVMLGDLIDRGPDSKGVLDFFLDERPAFATFHFIAGNHEEAMLRSLAPGADPREIGWLNYGGLEAVQSYGVPAEALELRGPALSDALRRHIPQRHIDFVASFEDKLQLGDYLFVHAGIRPGRAIADQTGDDLRWIRDDFLEDDSDHGVMVVHGHTIQPSPEVLANRIGIDTGAYLSGVLTALGLEHGTQWLLQTGR